MKTITSQSNPSFKDAIRLHNSRGRNKQNRIIIFGLNEIDRAFSAGVEIGQLFVCPGLLSSTGHAKVVGWQESCQECFDVTQPLFEKLAFGARADGVVAIANRPITSVEKLKRPRTIVVIESIEKPGNLGAVFRSCDGAGIGAIIVADALTDVFHPNSIRASLGTVFSLPSATMTAEKAIEFLAKNGYQILSARLDASRDFFECNLTIDTAIVLGNESKGLSKHWSAGPCQGIRLPMLGLADSLNISATAAVVAYEALRQIRSTNLDA